MTATQIAAADTYIPIMVTVGIWEDQFPCVVRLSDGSQPMTDTNWLGWKGDPIPRWNGFVAYPEFDRAAVEKMAALFASEGDEQIEWDGDTVILHSPEYADDPDYEPERIEPTVIDGVQRWDIGGCRWTWTEVDCTCAHGPGEHAGGPCRGTGRTLRGDYPNPPDEPCACPGYEAVAA